MFLTKIADTLEDINTNDGIVKKFKMSREEKHMNGAPEGELYDVTVLEDHEIKRVEGSNDEVLSRLRGELAKCSSIRSVLGRSLRNGGDDSSRHIMLRACQIARGRLRASRGLVRVVYSCYPLIA